jgi:hypothetical protein
MADPKVAQDTLHANIDTLWDAIALLEGALGHEDMREPVGAQRIVTIAVAKLREFDEIISPVI